jgi:hypothetical protein
MTASPSRWASAEAAACAIKHLESQGEVLSAHEIAYQAAHDFPGATELKYLAVRTLARAGGTAEALKLCHEWRLAEAPGEDPQALFGRLAKDSALRHTGPARLTRLADAADAYERVFRATRGSFSGVNAAAIWFLAGERERAWALIPEVSAACRGERPHDALGDYYRHATLAELALLAGDDAQAQRELEAAAAVGADLSARATTRRQLALICTARGISTDLLAALHMPVVVHYLGHRIAPPGSTGRFAAEQEGPVREAIEAWIARHDARFFFGALASGADILFAEAALALPRHELHVVLPFAAAEFREVSVRSSGAGWLERFDRCLKQASSVIAVTDGGFHGDEGLFAYGTRLAMGMAVLHGRRLGAEVRQAAVWDGVDTDMVAGTSVDVAAWRATGRTTDIIAPAPSLSVASGEAMTESGGEHLTSPPVGGRPRHDVRALLFGDFTGFSRLSDDEVLRFNDGPMAAIAEIIQSFGPAIDYRNSWGDAIFLATADVCLAARCALAIQSRVNRLELGSLGLRLAGHVGPVWRGRDHVRGEPAWLGLHVTRAARLEPKTIPGQVYVTEPFAAALVLADPVDIACEFVGTREAAKGYGPMRMYRLNPTED